MTFGTICEFLDAVRMSSDAHINMSVRYLFNFQAVVPVLILSNLF